MTAESTTVESTYSQRIIKEHIRDNPSYFMCSQRSVNRLVEKAKEEANKILCELQAFYKGNIGITIEPKEHGLCWSITATLTVNGKTVKTEDPCDLLFLELNDLMLKKLIEIRSDTDE